MPPDVHYFTNARNDDEGVVISSRNNSDIIPSLDIDVDSKSRADSVAGDDFSTASLNDPNLPSDHASPYRQGTIWSARINLLTSMVGGGSLSLPLAFSQAGNAFMAPVLVVFAAITAEFTLSALMNANTRASHVTGSFGGSSFESVATAAFGERARYFSMCLVILVCYIGTIGYAVLLRDLTVPLAHKISPPPDNDGDVNSRPTLLENSIMLVIVFLVTPLCTLKTLTALKNFGLLSMLSIFILTLCIVYRSIQCSAQTKSRTFAHVHVPHDYNWKDYVTYFPSSFADFMEALPLILSCFFCHFNAIPVHNELRNPTPSRVSYLTKTTSAFAALLYLLLGFMGSMFGNCTQSFMVQGNILLDFDDDDPVLIVGRICLMITVSLAFPMQIIPARDTLIRLVDLCRKKQRQESISNDVAGDAGGVDGALMERLLEEEDLDGDFLDPSALTNPTGSSSLPMPQRRNLSRSPPEDRKKHTIQRVLVALVLFWSGAGVACAVASVDVVWDVLGSSLVIIIGFLIPCGSYLVLTRGVKDDDKGPARNAWFRCCCSCGTMAYRRIFAYGTLVIYVPLMVICTTVAIWNIFR